MSDQRYRPPKLSLRIWKSKLLSHPSELSALQSLNHIRNESELLFFSIVEQFAIHDLCHFIVFFKHQLINESEVILGHGN